MPSRRTTEPFAGLTEKEIRELLVTWTARQVRSDVPSPDSEDPDWLWRHEQRHGIGFLQQRRGLLRAAFDALGKKSVDSGAVVQVLHDAKHDHLLAEISALDLEWPREIREEAEVVKRSAKQVLRRWCRLHDHLNPDRLSVLGRSRAAVQAALDALETDPALNLPIPATSRRRRERRGRPARPWLSTAKSRLATLGATRIQQHQLLRAVGLLELTADDRR
jgi:hypothetical protein